MGRDRQRCSRDGVGWGVGCDGAGWDGKGRYGMRQHETIWYETRCGMDRTGQDRTGTSAVHKRIDVRSQQRTLPACFTRTLNQDLELRPYLLTSTEPTALQHRWCS